MKFIQTIFKNFIFKILKLLLELRFNDMKLIDSKLKDLENINNIFEVEYIPKCIKKFNLNNMKVLFPEQFVLIYLPVPLSSLIDFYFFLSLNLLQQNESLPFSPRFYYR
jgi:hypothetical protein